MQEENAPRKLMVFGQALEALKNGHLIAREGWNGKGMYLCLIPAGNAVFRGFDMQDCIGLKSATGVMIPGWSAWTADLLATDWMIIK